MESSFWKTSDSTAAGSDSLSLSALVLVLPGLPSPQQVQQPGVGSQRGEALLLEEREALLSGGGSPPELEMPPGDFEIDLFTCIC